MKKAYNHRNCQSLFGYAVGVHRRSGGVCQLCDLGKTGLSFDLWRQLTVEHLIGESQCGYLKDIRKALAKRFPALTAKAREALAQQIHQANTVTACRFCNSSTSRDRQPCSMEQLILSAQGSPEDVLKSLQSQLETIRDKKRSAVEWKLKSVRKAFEKDVAPQLPKAGKSGADGRST